MAIPFDPGKYARPERERRFLLDRVPDGLGPPVHIRDRYLQGTRLRLRWVDGVDGTVRKLGHKVRTDPDDPAEVWITNLYLDEDEYDRLVGLPAAVLEKDRCRWPAFGGSVDVFAGTLADLVLAEIECADDVAFRAVAAPPGARADVTHDDRFSGGALAALDRRSLVILLGELTGT